MCQIHNMTYLPHPPLSYILLEVKLDNPCFRKAPTEALEPYLK